jgi:hypothetical protein
MAKHDLLGYLGKATEVGREVIGRFTAPQPFLILTATSDGETWTWPGDDANLAQMLMMMGTTNQGRIQFSLYEPVGAANYMEFFGQDSFEFGGVNLSDIYLTFEKAGDHIHLAYEIAGEGDLADLDTV